MHTPCHILTVGRVLEAVKTACVEVREELNRKVTRTLGTNEAALLEANLDAAAGLFAEITGTNPQ
jgi:hypothetical protein